MAKKRKSASATTRKSDVDAPAESSRKRIRTFEDVADSDDEFHLNRDRILLEEEPVAKRRRKAREEEAFLEVSEEEVLDESEAPSKQNDAGHEEISADESDVQRSEEEEEQEGWGASRADRYGADLIETEEQALEEEAEARRLQKKQLQNMSIADYGFDEDDWVDSTKTDKPQVVTEHLPEPEIPTDASSSERLKILRKRYPEFEPLSKELLQLSAVVSTMGATLPVSDQPVSRTRTKYNAATAYLGALTMYFALLTSSATKKDGNTALSAAKLRDHDVMTMLVDCRTLWQKVKALPDDEVQRREPSLTPGETVELQSELTNAQLPVPKVTSRKSRHEEAMQAAKQARIARNLDRMEEENADLDVLLATSRKAPKTARIPGTDEEVPLTAAQAEEKARRKKSLRFYTSQIAQKANKRGAAGRTAGGDDDIPHRERLRDRQARLNADAEKRGKRSTDHGDALGGDSDDQDAEEAQKIRQAVDDDDDYYDLMAARTAKKKSDKIAYGEAQRLANEQGGMVVEQEVVGGDGKRKITYAIEKNKGLTPHRKKDVRNPRVKKRKKYEEKTKKLATMKATYKRGEGRGGYGGELTGIKANLVKSIKL